MFFSPPTSKLWLPSCPGTLWQNKPTNMLMNNSNFSPVMYENRDAKETPVAPVGSTRLNLSGPARRGSPQLSSSRGGEKKTTHIVLELMETMESDHTIVSTTRFVNWRGQERRDAAKTDGFTFLIYVFDVVRWWTSETSSLMLTPFIFWTNLIDDNKLQLKKKHWFQVKKSHSWAKFAQNSKKTQFSTRHTNTYDSI